MTKASRGIFMRRLGYTAFILRQIWDFAKHEKVFWIVPIVLILGLMALIITSPSPSALKHAELIEWPGRGVARQS